MERNWCVVSRYLVTTFKVVPRGTEGAVSVEGTFAGIFASILLASVGCLTGQVSLIIVSFRLFSDFTHVLMLFTSMFSYFFLYSLICLFTSTLNKLFSLPL